VDSSDIAFKIAGALALKEGIKQARPTLLEPIMHVEVYAPEQYSGDIMGNLSGRRGRISGSEIARLERGDQSPGAAGRDAQLRHRLEPRWTQGRASYSMEFSHYDFVPNEIAEKSDRRSQSRARRRAGGRGSLEDVS